MTRKDFLKDLDPTNNSTNITKSEKKEVKEKDISIDIPTNNLTR